jgi:hypothetical protein
LKTIRPNVEPSFAELDANSRALEARLVRQTQVFETRYELPSAEVERAVDEGRIRETAEVAEWIIAMRALRRIERERQARAE